MDYKDFLLGYVHARIKKQAGRSRFIERVKLKAILRGMHNPNVPYAYIDLWIELLVREQLLKPLLAGHEQKYELLRPRWERDIGPEDIRNRLLEDRVKRFPPPLSSL